MASPVLFSLIIESLTESFKKAISCEEAYQEMEALSAKYLGSVPDEHTRRSAVLMLLYPCEDKVCFPLILRRNYNGFHSGEVSFPGGKYEPSDKDIISTALREAKEETGSHENDVHVLGTLTEIFIGPSNFMVLPVVGYIPYRPTFLPNAYEVEQLFEVQLDHFSNAQNMGISEIIIPGDKVLTPYYELEGHKIWGATAKVINELLHLTGSDKIDIKK